MNFDDSAQLKALSALPPDLPRAEPRWNAWSTPLRALPAAAAETLAGAAEVVTGVARQLEFDRTNPYSPRQMRDLGIQRPKFSGESDVSASLRNVAELYRYDAATAGLAERLVFDVTRILGKAVGYGLTTGPAAIPLLAADEGLSVADQLQRQGVADATAAEAGVVAALATGVGAVIPVAPLAKGFTLANLGKTAALAAVSGPATFAAQAVMTRDILERANYEELAKRYDPLDPVGLAVSAVAPFALGALSLRGARLGGPKAPARPETAPPSPERVPAEPTAAPAPLPLAGREAIDAAMVHNLTLLREVHDAVATEKPVAGQDTTPRQPGDSNTGAAHMTPEVLAAGRAFVLQVEALAEKHGKVYVRWSPTSEGDLIGTQQSRDFVVGELHNGLSAVEVTSATHPVDIAAALAEYGFLRMQDRRSRPRVYLADRVGTDSDGHSLIKPRRMLAEADQAVVRAIDAHFDEAMHLEDEIRKAENRLQRITDQGAKNIVERTLQEDRAKLTALVGKQNEQGASVLPGPSGAGRLAEVLTERGNTAAVRYRLAEATDVVASHGDDLSVNPDYPAELQPRDRTRAASADQIARIEANLRPALLGESVKASDGAPIIGPDLVVESGNARMIALRRAYETGKADAYRTWLEAEAPRFGLDPAEVQAMRRPVLVRERLGNLDRAEFARQANESPIAQFSPAEQAKADAARLGDLSGLRATDDGTINAVQSAAFVRQFMRQAVSPTERGAMMQAGGQLSQAGQQRIRNAVFAKAYGDADLVAMLTESTDSNVRNILAGMVRAAPDVARLNDLIAAGARHPVDVVAGMVRAVREFAHLRAAGISLDDFLAQGDLIGGGLPPEVHNLLTGLRENARSPRRIAEMVRQAVRAVDELGDPRQASMLAQEPTSQADLTANVVERLRTITDEQLTQTEPDRIGPAVDPLMRSVAERVAQVETTAPDLVVRMGDDGKPITAADEMALARQEAAQGTATELGALDADLVRVAADCALTMALV